MTSMTFSQSFLWQPRISQRSTALDVKMHRGGVGWGGVCICLLYQHPLPMSQNWETFGQVLFRRYGCSSALISDKWPLKVQCTFVSGCICCRIIRGGREKSGRFLYITVIEQECSMTILSGRSSAGGQTPQVEWMTIDRYDKSKPPKTAAIHT